MTKRYKTKDNSALRSVLTGFLIATLSFFGCMLLATLILYLGSDPTYKSELWSFGAMLLSGALAGFINAKRCGEGGAIIATLAGLALVLVLFLVGVVFSGLPSLPSVINYLLYIAISAVSAILASREPKRKHRR